MSTINPEFYAPYNYQPDVPRSRHNLSTKRSTTLQTGALVPILFHRVYKGDDFKISPMSLLQTILPFNRQLLDCFELRSEFYLCPLSNYYGWMDNNSKESVEDIAEGSDKITVNLFDTANGEGLFTPIEDGVVWNSLRDFYDRSDCVKCGSLMQYCGVPAGFVGDYRTGGFVDIDPGLFNTINIERHLCYLDIVRCFHLNQQFEGVPFFNGLKFDTSATSASIWGYPFDDVKQLDDIFTTLRYATRDVKGNYELHTLVNDYPELMPLLKWMQLTNKVNGGLFPVQHRPNLWQNLLSSKTGTVKAVVRTDESGNVFVSEIRDKNHLQDLYDAWYLSGGRYGNRLRTSFGLRSYHELKMPELLGTVRHLIDPSNITATSESGDYTVGEKAANVDKFNADGGTIRVRPDVDSYLVCVVSITPLVGFSQGFDPDVTHLSFNDDFTPELQGLSFDSVPRGFYSALPQFTSVDGGDMSLVSNRLTEEVGKNVKWMHYRTDVNHNYGEFTSLFGVYDDMVLTRKYSQNFFMEDLEFGELKDNNLVFDLSPYVNPLEFNNIFSNNSTFDAPWSLHYSFKIDAKRPILKRIKPSM